MHSNKFVPVALVLLLTPLSEAQVAERCTLSTLMDCAIQDAELRSLAVNGSWKGKFSFLCELEDIPCGIEESPSDRLPGSMDGHEELFLHGRTQMTVREILNELVSMHPGYRWLYQDGVLNIIPVAGKEYRDSAGPLLERRIHAFHEADIRASAAFEDACKRGGIRLWGLKDVREVLNQLWITLSSLAHGYSIQQSLTRMGPGLSGVYTAKVTLTLANASVREVLDAIAKADGRVFWEFSYDPESRSYSMKVESWESDVPGRRLTNH